ncbi:MAG: FAD:protein FMN transferase [Bacteroidetes bacterium]|nr:FAD:protein FMN transferase [Bacteroidota bacterium]
MKTVVLAVFFIVSSCGQNALYHTISGLTFGTIQYNVTYQGKKNIDLQRQIDSVLSAVNESMSTYVPHSTISLLNKADKKAWVDDLFKRVFTKSKEVYALSNGAFDPTIGPLMKLWGFRETDVSKVDSQQVDSILAFVGMDKLTLKGDTVYKSNSNVHLDFGAIAKGFGVDLVAEYLTLNGYQNFLVEIGGEARGQGVNKRGQAWVLEILTPDTSTKSANGFALADLNNKSIATSGNYKQYKVVDGLLRVHTINPKTGYGSIHNLLSTSIVATDCITADALSTACMVMGLEPSTKWLQQIKGVDYFLIYQQADGKLNFKQNPEGKDYLRIGL